MKKKKIIFDMGLNIFASAIPIICLQLILLPVLARKMSSDRYGLLVTVLALLNVLPSTMGNVLNNIRLLYNEKYEEKRVKGDFNLLMLISAIICGIVLTIFSIAYDEEITVGGLVLTVVVSVGWLMREYYIVAFRLKIDYMAILINNLLQAVGYVAGYAVFLLSGYWQWIYLSGYLLALVHIMIKSDLAKETFRKTPLFKTVTVQGSLLLVSNLLNRIITYADKLLIYPLLGGTVVSVFYAATVFGKVIALIITPVTSVVLTYLAKMKTKSDSAFKYSLVSGTVVCIVGYFVCIIISRPVLSLLYPMYVDEAMKYIAITTGTTVVQTLVSIINPFILKFFDMKWQIAINGGTTIVYVVLCLGFLSVAGLMGFCVGALLTNIFKLIFMIIIYYKSSTVE